MGLLLWSLSMMACAAAGPAGAALGDPSLTLGSAQGSPADPTSNFADNSASSAFALGGPSVAHSAPLPAGLPSPAFDPDCNSLTGKCHGVVFFYEEHRSYSPLEQNQMKTEFSGHFYQDKADESGRPWTCCSARWILVTESQGGTCQLVQVEEDGAIHVAFLSNREVPGISVKMAKEGFVPPPGERDCRTLEAAFEGYVVPYYGSNLCEKNFLSAGHSIEFYQDHEIAFDLDILPTERECRELLAPPADNFKKRIGNIKSNDTSDWIVK